MALGYLLCRTADTIADTGAYPPETRIQRLKNFHETITARVPTDDSLKTLFDALKEISGSAAPSEKILLLSMDKIHAEYERLFRSDQAFINDVLAAVTRGMRFDLECFGPPEEPARPLADEKEWEAYLHWIGGEPGRFWTKVCLHHLPTLQIRNPDKWMEDGIVFGTGLQMVNILRDLSSDLKNGRCYIPHTLLKEHNLEVEDLMTGAKADRFLSLFHQLIDQALLRLQRGLSYIEQIPVSHWRLRAAVWWPLMLGLETLKLLRLDPAPLKSTPPVKVKKGLVVRLLLRSLMDLPSNVFLRKQFSLKAAAASSSSGF